MSGLGRILFCWPSACFSTKDVAQGVHNALTAQGADLVDYLLWRRIEWSQAGMDALWPADKCPPDGADGGPDYNSVLEYASEGLLHRAVLNGCRWILVINGMGLMPDSLVAAKRCGIKIACWFTESPYETRHDAELQLAQFVDVAFTNERTAVDHFPSPMRQYIPHAFDPAVHYPHEPRDEDRCDVFFLGTGFGDRLALLESMDFRGIDFRFGGLWPGCQKPSWLAEHLQFFCTENAQVAQMYAGAKIVLNPHRYHPDATCANPRVFEVAACGGFQIADYREEIGEIFGDAIPMYQPGKAYELQALIRKYLGDETARLDCAERALRAVQEHTFAKRAEQIIGAMEAFDRRESESPILVSQPG